MSYDSRVEGSLYLEPFPEGADVPPLREALAALSSPAAGKVALTPLGRGVVLEDTVDWEAAIEALRRARDTILAPRGIALAGSLRALGEDGAHLATIAFGAEGVRVERHDSAEDGESAEKEAEWAEFCENAEEEGLGAYVEGLVRLCVPSLLLVPKRRSKLKSRLGGLPRAPAGFAWPVSSTGEPLALVAQISLAEVRAAGLPGAEALPPNGVLSFFHGYEPSPDGAHTGNAGRVLFFDEETPLAPARAPVHPSFSVLPSVPIAFDLQTEQLPPLESPFYALLLAEAGALEGDPFASGAEVFGDFVARYGQPGVRDEEESRPVHRLLGYADPLQSDVYLSTEGQSTKLPFEAWNTMDHHRAAARWRLLLQVDSDPAREVLFGDNGVLAFMIREDDLAARRFDRVWVEWQSH